LASHVRLLQQGCPAPPHTTQVVPPGPHVAFGPVHVPMQQGWPLAPQVPQLPFMQAPPSMGQLEPVAEQVLFTQQPPPPHVFSVQHG